MTLRCINAERLTVVDPCEWPESVHRRYRNYDINFLRAAGEDLDKCHLRQFDEVWIYNVLQHVQDPEKVIANALARIAPGGVLRMFEWLYIPADDCHPHVSTPELLLNALQGCCIVKVGLPLPQRILVRCDGFHRSFLKTMKRFLALLLLVAFFGCEPEPGPSSWCRHVGRSSARSSCPSGPAPSWCLSSLSP